MDVMLDTPLDDKKGVTFKSLENIDEEEETLLEEHELSYELFVAPTEEEAQFGTIVRDTFGFFKKRPVEEEDPEKAQVPAEAVVHRYTLFSPSGVAVQVMTLGATIISVRMPDNQNRMSEVILGFETLQEYMDAEKNGLCFGSVLGRFSSVISDGHIKIDREEYCLSTNIKGISHEAGGFRGFDKVLWDSHVAHDRVIMSHVSPDGDEGYPGTLMIQVSFQLTGLDGQLIVDVSATTSKPTILSLTHNLYFNMAGHETGPDGVKEHTLILNADRYVKLSDTTKIPTGDLEEVTSSYFDLRVPRPIWKAMKKLPGGGYNHTFCLTKSPQRSLCYAGRLMHPNSGRYLEIMTDMHGIHIDTGTKLPDPDTLPPLEAQTGFVEELTYPQFCREEKKMEEYAKELQERVSAKQSWNQMEEPEDNEKIEAMLQDNQEAKKPSKAEEEGGQDFPDLKEQISNEGDIDGEDEQIDLLKDDAESDEEETRRPQWTPPQPIVGKKGALYRFNGAICIRPQEYPDCIKYENFPKPIVRPGETFRSTTVYKFGIIRRKNPQTKYFFL